jgi:hypothetical protein
MHSEDILGDSGRSREDTGLCRSTTVTILDSLDANVSYRLSSVSRLICDFSVS